jgi:hypothetical protein
MWGIIGLVVGILIGAVGAWFILRNNPNLLKIEDTILTCNAVTTQKLCEIAAEIDCISIKLGCKVDPSCKEPAKP